MIGLSRLKRAISDVPPGGMQTGDPKVKLRLCDAQRIEVEYAAIISERDAALAQNAELVAQVEYLKSHFNELAEVAQRCDSWESFPQQPIDRALGALQSMPNQCLRQIQADAILSAIKFFKGSRDIDVEALESYANRVKAGEL